MVVEIMAALLSSSLWSKLPDAVGFSPVSLSVTVSEILLFPVLAANSGCRSLLESPRGVLFELAVVENLRFTAGIFMISLSGRIAIFGCPSSSK